MALRAFKRQRFAPRGKWNSPICLGAIFALLLATWMPTIAWPMFNRCFGSLIWFTVRYELISICILSILVFSFLLLAALISIQLMRTTDVDHNERIAASRMCYYLLMVTVVYVSSLKVLLKHQLMYDTGHGDSRRNPSPSTRLHEHAGHFKNCRNLSLHLWNRRGILPSFPPCKRHPLGHQASQGNECTINTEATADSLLWSQRLGNEHQWSYRFARWQASGQPTRPD